MDRALIMYLFEFYIEDMLNRTAHILSRSLGTNEGQIIEVFFDAD